MFDKNTSCFNIILFNLCPNLNLHKFKLYAQSDSQGILITTVIALVLLAIRTLSRQAIQDQDNTNFVHFICLMCPRRFFLNFI